jgi:hypothetical protein
MELAQQSSRRTSQPKPTVSIVLDSVNHYRRVKAKYGPQAEPDWDSLLRDAKDAGFVTAAVAVVNKGVNPAMWNRFEDAGYTVRRALADDCDELVIAEIVKTSRRADIVVIGGGDHKYADIAALLRQLGKYVIVTGVSGSVAYELLAASDDFVNLPVSHPVPPTLPVSADHLRAPANAQCGIPRRT